MLDLREVARLAQYRDALTFELLKADGEKILVLEASSEAVSRAAAGEMCTCDPGGSRDCLRFSRHCLDQGQSLASY